MLLLIIALIYLIVLNIVGFILCGADKNYARKSKRRIPERTLLRLSFFGGAFGIALGMGTFRHKTKHLKFKMIIPGTCILWAIVVIHMASGFTLDRQIQYLEVPFSSSDIPESLDGYRVAFVTDTHALPDEDLREVVQNINEYRPDLLLLGGDFGLVNGSPEHSIEILADVQSVDGIFGVEGNHDKYRELFAAMEKHGVTPLSNNGVAIRERLHLSGTEDLWNRSPDIARAVSDAEADDFTILLAHNPDVTMEQSTENIDLILCGHTHGGYANFFGVFSPALSWIDHVTEYGQRFMSGRAKSRDGAAVFVSNDTGHFAIAPRIFARPQVIILTLEHN